MRAAGIGPFDTDGALDFIAEVARRSPDRRAMALEHMFSFVVGHPDLLGEEFFPDEILVAAGIVAASVPGGERFERRLVELAGGDTDLDATLPDCGSHLARPALDALRLVAAAGAVGSADDDLVAVLSAASA
jgi:hypothetical protein